MDSPQPGKLVHAQGEIAWKARLHPRVHSTFATLFGTEDLSVSTDIPSMFYTPEGASAKDDNFQWLHVDQNTLTGLEYECYQGVLYIRASDGEASTTTVICPGSHADDVYGSLLGDPVAAERAKIIDDSGVHSGQFLCLNKLKDTTIQEKLMKHALVHSKRIPMPAGSLLLWNSKTIHQGWEGGQRFAIPVCWEPRSRVGSDARNRKLFVAAAGAATSHSPSEGRVHPCVATRRGPHARLHRPVARPYAVLPEKDLPTSEWDALWERWTGEEFIEAIVGTFDPELISKALRPEIQAVL